MVNILAFPGSRNAPPAESQPSAGPDRGARPLLTATPDGTVIISASRRPDGTMFPLGDWTNQELADLYRVEALLVQANIRISTGRGLSDEGDPWFVFCKEDGDVFVHLARSDNSYLLDSPGLGEILYGSAFAVLIERFIQIAAAKATPSSNIVTLRPKMGRDSVVRLHPAVMLAALVWSLYLASSKFGGVAHAADDLSGQHSDAAHHDGHAPSSPADIDGALAHLVEHLPKSEVLPAAAVTVPSERAASLVDTGDKNGLDLRGAAAGFSSQGVAASLTVIAFSYGLYISADEQHLTQEVAGKSGPLPAPVEEQHSADPTPATLAAIAVLKEASQHVSNPAEVADATVVDDSNPKSVLPLPVLNAVHDVKLVTDSAQFFSVMHAASAAAQAMASDFLSHRDDKNITLEKLLAAPAKTVADHAPTSDTVSADTQSVLGLISHYLGSGDVYKVGDLTVSATFDIDDLDKVLSHLGDQTGALPYAGIADAANGASAALKAHANVATAAPPAAPSVSPAQATPAYAHYDDQAKQFVTHFIQESSSIQMVQINSTIVLVDMSAMADTNDQIYTRSWSTDDGHVISTIGHIQDFAAQGMV